MTAGIRRFDVIVIGGGPAGIMAAVAARRQGATVALLDENHAAGGQVYRPLPRGFKAVLPGPEIHAVGAFAS